MTTPQTDLNELENSAPPDNPEDNIEAAVAAVEAAEAPSEETVVPSPSSQETPESPVEVPSELIATPAPVIDARDQELAQLRLERAQVLQLQATQQQELYLQQLQADYEARGFDPEAAKYMAQEIRAERARGEQNLAQAQQATQLAQAKQNAANYYGNQYGVNPQALVNFNHPDDMERYAQLLQYTGKLDKRVSVVEKNQVPEQDFDSGQGTAGGPRGNNDLVNLYGDPSVDLDLTPEKRAELSKFLGLEGA